MVAKVTISLSEDLLARLDAEAETLGVSRSLIVQEATASYLSKGARERAAAERRRRIQDSIEGMREMATRNPRRDGRSSLDVLRDVRSIEDAK